MAYLQSRKNKEGQVVSYSIRVYKGRDPRTGKQLTPYTMTWRVPEGWSEKRARKEAEKQAAVFERQCREGYLSDGRQTFAQYAEYVLGLKERTGLKHLTLIHYRQSLKRVLPFLGHLRLGEIRPQHLNYVYQQLSLPEAREDNERALARPALWQVLDARQATAYLVGKNGRRISLDRLRQGEPVKPATARRVAEALELPYSLLFTTQREEKRLSGRTIMNCHLVISIVLGQAEKEMRIPLNPAHRASPPKGERPDPNYFQMEEVTDILSALDREPLKWRAAVHLLLVSGCRRGELLGLKWDHVDWENQQIHIDCTLLYAGDRGVYEGTPKTKDSVRTIKLPEQTMGLLREYQSWQEGRRKELGERWEDSPLCVPRGTRGTDEPQPAGELAGEVPKAAQSAPSEPPRFSSHHDQYAVFSRGGQCEHQPPAGPQQRVHHHQHLQPRDAAGGKPHQRLHGGCVVGHSKGPARGRGGLAGTVKFPRRGPLQSAAAPFSFGVHRDRPAVRCWPQKTREVEEKLKFFTRFPGNTRGSRRVFHNFPRAS